MSRHFVGSTYVGQCRRNHNYLRTRVNEWNLLSFGPTFRDRRKKIPLVVTRTIYGMSGPIRKPSASMISPTHVCPTRRTLHQTGVILLSRIVFNSFTTDSVVQITPPHFRDLLNMRRTMRNIPRASRRCLRGECPASSISRVCPAHLRCCLLCLDSRGMCDTSVDIS